MRIRRINSESIELSELEPLCCDFLEQIVVSAQVDDHPAASERIYSSPTQGREPSFEQDWKNYVEPDLRNSFKSAQEVVTSDLKKSRPKEPRKTYTLRIPMKNLEAWIHTLNQARLALSARYDFTQSDMENPLPFDGEERSLALFRVHFYGFLQECFLRELD